MIEFQQGDLLRAYAEALVNAVNCVGVMGRGIALQFRKELPDNFTAYKASCDRGELRPGRMFVFELQSVKNPRYIINFPTKRHWKGKSKIEDIQAGLVTLIDELRRRNIRSVAVPPLGCGLGGLRWSEVRPLLLDAFRSLPDVRVLIYGQG
ncbi:MAG TPA: macro domain-containing protein [Lacipirellulaceae bacterium]|nr:macro domain-containing protein [Lacipirellulaceae bacterium]